VSIEDFMKYRAKESNVQRLIRLLEDNLRKSVKEVPSTEEELEDIINDLCLQVDPLLVRERLREIFFGVYKIDFSLFNHSVALEVKLIREERELERAVAEVVSHIPPFCSIYNHIVFLFYDACDAIKDVNKFVKEIEGKAENITVMTVKHQGYLEA